MQTGTLQYEYVSVCSICTKDIVNNNFYMVKGCNHRFHTQCLLRVWEMGAHGCPCCRGNSDNKVNEFLAKFDELQKEKELYDKVCSELENELEIRGIREFGYINIFDLPEDKKMKFFQKNSAYMFQLRDVRHKLEDIEKKLKSYKILLE